MPVLQKRYRRYRIREHAIDKETTVRSYVELSALLALVPPPKNMGCNKASQALRVSQWDR